MNVKPNPPRICDYLKASCFLQAYYEFRKARCRAFSFEGWARELDLKSKSYLRSVVKGLRCPGPQGRARIVRSLARSPLEARMLEKLFQLEWSRSGTEIAAIQKEFRMLARQNSDLVEIQDTDSFLSSSLAPLVLTLLSFEDIERDISGLAAATGYPPAAISGALACLENQGLAERDGKVARGGWRSVRSSFRMRAARKDPAVARYNAELLREISNKLAAGREQPHDSFLKSCWVALRPDEYEAFSSELNAFIEERLAHYDGNSLKGKSLFQLNLQMFPVLRS